MEITENNQRWLYSSWVCEYASLPYCHSSLSFNMCQG